MPSKVEQLLAPLTFDYVTEIDVYERAAVNGGANVDEVGIKGKALYPGTSKNFNLWTYETIKEAANSLKGVPIQADHSRSARDTIGRVDAIEFDEGNGNLNFEGYLQANDPVAQKVKSKLVRNVSVAGKAKEANCSVCSEKMSWLHEHIPGRTYKTKEGKKVVAKIDLKGVVFEHLGVVTFPGMTKAGVKVAQSFGESIEYSIAEYFKNTESDENDKHETPNEQMSFVESDMDEIEKLKLENEKISLQLQEKNDELATTTSKVKTLEETSSALQISIQNDKVRRVVEMETKLGRVKSDDLDKLRTELNGLTSSRLQAREEYIQEKYDLNQGDSSPNKKKKVTGKSADFSDERQFSDEYIKEARLDYLHSKLFPGEPVATSAIETLSSWDKRKGRWINPMENIFN